MISDGSSPTRLHSASLASSICPSRSISAMPTGALAKKRRKRWRESLSCSSHSRSGVRSRTTERVRRRSPSRTTLWVIRAWMSRPWRPFSVTSPRVSPPSKGACGGLPGGAGVSRKSVRRAPLSTNCCGCAPSQDASASLTNSNRPVWSTE